MKNAKLIFIIVGLSLVFAGCSKNDEAAVEEEERQAILNMMAGFGSVFSSITGQTSQHGNIESVEGFKTLAAIQIPINQQLPGFTGSAHMLGNMKLSVSSKGVISGNFMVTTTFDNARGGGFLFNGSQTDTGTISGNVAGLNVNNKMVIDFSTITSMDYTVDHHSHSANLRTVIEVTTSGGSGKSSGIIDHEYYSTSFTF